MKFANPLKKLKTIASIRGHVVDFPGRKPTQDNPDGLTWVNVPAAIEHEAVAAGLMPESELVEDETPASPKAPEGAEARQAALFKAFTVLVNRGEREEFSGNGAPKIGPLNAVLGWNADPKEVKLAWPIYQATHTDDDEK